MRKLIYIITILTIVSCSGKEETPKDVLPPEKMALVLADIYMAEHKVDQIGVSTDSAKVVLKHYELKIFEDYSTSDSMYKQSFKYYLDHPAKLEAVYDIVIDSLSLRQEIKNTKNKE